MLLSAALVPPDWAQEEVQALTTRLVSMVGELQEGAARPFVLPITGFGNLTTPEAKRVVETLEAALEAVEDQPLVRFEGPMITSGGVVRLGMAGEVDQLLDLARSVPAAVGRLRLYVDRRGFWPGLTLGRTTAPPAAVEGLRAWVGSDWRASTVSILRNGNVATVHAELAVGSATRLAH